jgi:hypothetical protein
MRGVVIGGVVTGCAAVLLACAVHGQGKLKGRSSGWLTSYEAGRALARQTGKPLFVVFRCEP